MDLINHLARYTHYTRSTARSARPLAEAPRETAPDTAAVPDAADPPRGCGWFDSSHELQRGLHVTEHDSPDSVANDLPLDVWITWHLHSAPPAALCASSGH